MNKPIRRQRSVGFLKERVRVIHPEFTAVNPGQIAGFDVEQAQSGLGIDVTEGQNAIGVLVKPLGVQARRPA